MIKKQSNSNNKCKLCYLKRCLCTQKFYLFNVTSFFLLLLVLFLCLLKIVYYCLKVFKMYLFYSWMFFRQTSPLFHNWLAERFNLDDAWIVNVGYKNTSIYNALITWICDSIFVKNWVSLCVQMEYGSPLQDKTSFKESLKIPKR
jgi:hypothetical protein